MCSPIVCSTPTKTFLEKLGTTMNATFCKAKKHQPFIKPCFCFKRNPARPGGQKARRCHHVFPWPWWFHWPRRGTSQPHSVGTASRILGGAWGIGGEQLNTGRRLKRDLKREHIFFQRFGLIYNCSGDFDTCLSSMIPWWKGIFEPFGSWAPVSIIPRAWSSRQEPFGRPCSPNEILKWFKIKKRNFNDELWVTWRNRQVLGTSSLDPKQFLERDRRTVLRARTATCASPSRARPSGDISPAARLFG